MASGHHLADVMKRIPTWGGAPHAWLKGRIELAERAGPVVEVLVRLALGGIIVFPRASHSKRGGFSCKDCVEMLKTELRACEPQGEIRLSCMVPCISLLFAFDSNTKKLSTIGKS